MYTVYIYDYSNNLVSDVQLSILQASTSQYIAQNLTPSGGRVTGALSAYYLGDYEIQIIGSGWRTDYFEQSVDGAGCAVVLRVQRSFVSLSFVYGGVQQADVAFYANGEALRCDALVCSVPNVRGTFPLTVSLRKGRYRATQQTFDVYADAFVVPVTRLYGGLRPWAWWVIVCAVAAVLAALTAAFCVLRRRRGRVSARREDALQLPVHQRYE